MDLKIVKYGNQLVVDSRDVAEMLEKDHKHLLRDIQGYLEILGQSNFGLTDFFIESTYISGQNKTLPCYLITKKGCDMVANKMTAPSRPTEITTGRAILKVRAMDGPP